MFEEFNISAMADAYIVPYAANIALALAIFLVGKWLVGKCSGRTISGRDVFWSENVWPENFP